MHKFSFRLQSYLLIPALASLGLSGCVTPIPYDKLAPVDTTVAANSKGDAEVWQGYPGARLPADQEAMLSGATIDAQYTYLSLEQYERILITCVDFKRTINFFGTRSVPPEHVALMPGRHTLRIDYRIGDFAKDSVVTPPSKLWFEAEAGHKYAIDRQFAIAKTSHRYKITLAIKDITTNQIVGGIDPVAKPTADADRACTL